ncbi:hypothetical protein ACMA1D_10735 [Streptomyces sp. 796.1]|uniref:hypothetical protein n=1 Tax=Streptomyces sp. 796.1 TaxID=3163029 RepID=UPI0039C9A6D8
MTSLASKANLIEVAHLRIRVRQSLNPLDDLFEPQQQRRLVTRPQPRAETRLAQVRFELVSDVVPHRDQRSPQVTTVHRLLKRHPIHATAPC